MSAFEKITPQPVQPVRVPKNHRRLVFTILGVLLALAAAVLIVIGFFDASIVAPEETEGPAPEIVVPGTLPD